LSESQRGLLAPGGSAVDNCEGEDDDKNLRAGGKSAVAGDPAGKDAFGEYSRFIEEIFILPIKTVVVVDDEYPTIDDFLNGSLRLKDDAGEIVASSRTKMDNCERVREILAFCRSRVPSPWLVDIHDGKAPPLVAEVQNASHLSHSDLLILDYHLEANNGSEKAIEILQELARNGHLNLVVVYTKDREEAGGGIDRAIDEIALGLTSPDARFNLHEQRVKNLQERFSAWEELQDDIYKQLIDCLDSNLFLFLQRRANISWAQLCDLPEVSQLSRFLSQIPDGVSMSPDEMVLFLLHKSQELFKIKMFNGPNSRPLVKRDDFGNNFIQTDSVFVTVVSKEHPASTLPDHLLNALVAWDPSPHRLILSAMRNQIISEGSFAESGVLRNLSLQAGWFKDILEPNPLKLRSNVRQDVARHWESLGDKIGQNVVRFAERLAAYLVQESANPGLMDRFDSLGAYKDETQVSLNLNCYACTKPISGFHLSTGHILRVSHKKLPVQYWVCLTPACDLVPGQGGTKGWRKRLGEWLPFKAVRLFPVDSLAASKNAHRANNLFIDLNGKIETFGFFEPTGEDDFEVPALRWEQCYASGNGILDGNNGFKVACIGSRGTLGYDEHDAAVVAQLRYEYALNLMNRLGAHLSRVGLGFIPLKS